MLQYCIARIHQITLNANTENALHKFLRAFHKSLLTFPLEILIFKG